MTRPSHPIFAGLTREGGAAARLMADLERSADRIAALDATLDDMPLTAPPDWGGLMAGQGSDAQLGALLARLAAPEAAPVAPVRRASGIAPLPGAGAVPGPPLAQPPGDGRKVAAVAPASPDMRARLLQAADQAALVAAPAGAVAPVSVAPVSVPVANGSGALPQDLRLRARERALAGTPTPAPRLRTGSDRVALLRASASDPVLQGALTRAVALSRPADRAEAVARILRGQSAVVAPQPAGDAMPDSAAQARIATALSRIASAGGGGGDAPAPRIAPPMPGDLAAPQRPVAPDPVPQMPQTLPRNGLERLLQRAGKGRVQVAPNLANDPGRQAAVAVAPDLAQSQRPEAQMRPATSEAPQGAPLDPQAMAQALADHIRQEARAAGIDLGGGGA